MPVEFQVCDWKQKKEVLVNELNVKIKYSINIKYVFPVQKLHNGGNMMYLHHLTSGDITMFIRQKHLCIYSAINMSFIKENRNNIKTFNV